MEVRSGSSQAITRSTQTSPAHDLFRYHVVSLSVSARSVSQSIAGRPRRVCLLRFSRGGTAIRPWGRSSLLFAYALGKSQRLLAGLAAAAQADQGLPGLIYTHGAVEAMNRAYRDAGIDLPPTTYVADAGANVKWSTALVVAPPSAHGTVWARKFGPASTAFASGWMRIRGTRRRRSIDRGFVLSDHVDWPALLATIDATGAEKVWLTHGYTAVVTRWLKEHGKDARAVATHYEGERDETAESLEKPKDQVLVSDAGDERLFS